MIEIRQTETYSQWFKNLRDSQARARIDIRIRRLSALVSSDQSWKKLWCKALRK
ncbi:MAG: hypothetical protein KA717_07330 [Woronichinia naegeliana WA131]|jgi:putative component of toxin-antitoxin plasmid stabilization module|uniref:Uncharacterized protein n=1 Tax=Woronichinia naegeliana WA131 TaxID=2824559 RepID=A0A977PXR8_9CYAN|nr:MAG: hypothetical protein KA717_07330 [Woronichinia naegeliana WA131]